VLDKINTNSHLADVEQKWIESPHTQLGQGQTLGTVIEKIGGPPTPQINKSIYDMYDVL